MSCPGALSEAVICPILYTEMGIKQGRDEAHQMSVGRLTFPLGIGVGRVRKDKVLFLGNYRGLQNVLSHLL